MVLIFYLFLGDAYINTLMVTETSGLFKNRRLFCCLLYKTLDVVNLNSVLPGNMVHNHRFKNPHSKVPWSNSLTNICNWFYFSFYKFPLIWSSIYFHKNYPDPGISWNHQNIFFNVISSPNKLKSEKENSSHFNSFVANSLSVN